MDRGLRAVYGKRRPPLYGLDPVFCQMLRICRLDRLFEIHPEEGEASPSAARCDANGP
jgi:hypothetical protein